MTKEKRLIATNKTEEKKDIYNTMEKYCIKQKYGKNVSYQRKVIRKRSQNE